MTSKTLRVVTHSEVHREMAYLKLGLCGLDGDPEDFHVTRRKVNTLLLLFGRHVDGSRLVRVMRMSVVLLLKSGCLDLGVQCSSRMKLCERVEVGKDVILYQTHNHFT
jgi:hypothetical protein